MTKNVQENSKNIKESVKKLDFLLLSSADRAEKDSKIKIYNSNQSENLLESAPTGTQDNPFEKARKVTDFKV